jgi:hypothetical protein
MELLTWSDTFPTFAVNIMHVEKLKKVPPGRNLQVKNMEIYLASDEKITPGAWCVLPCQHKGCTNKVGYWSITGYPKPEYKNAKCEDHRK